MDAIRVRLGAEETPVTLWAYAAVAAIGWVIGTAQRGGSHPALQIFTFVFLVLLVYFVIRGSRVAWILVTGSSVFELLSSPFRHDSWWTLALSIVGLALMLAPASWRFVWRPKTRLTAAVRTTLGTGENSTSDNLASGWYIDPDSSRRMRYWSADDQRWLGFSKTPRKLRKQWDELARRRAHG